jgi:hypothetical protein
MLPAGRYIATSHSGNSVKLWMPLARRQGFPSSLSWRFVSLEHAHCPRSGSHVEKTVGRSNQSLAPVGQVSHAAKCVAPPSPLMAISLVRSLRGTAGRLSAQQWTPAALSPSAHRYPTAVGTHFPSLPRLACPVALETRGQSRLLGLGDDELGGRMCRAGPGCRRRHHAISASHAQRDRRACCKVDGCLPSSSHPRSSTQSHPSPPNEPLALAQLAEHGTVVIPTSRYARVAGSIPACKNFVPFLCGSIILSRPRGRPAVRASDRPRRTLSSRGACADCPARAYCGTG